MNEKRKRYEISIKLNDPGSVSKYNYGHSRYINITTVTVDIYIYKNVATGKRLKK